MHFVDIVRNGILCSRYSVRIHIGPISGYCMQVDTTYIIKSKIHLIIKNNFREKYIDAGSFK